MCARVCVAAGGLAVSAAWSLSCESSGSACSVVEEGLRHLKGPHYGTNARGRCLAEFAHPGMG